MVQLLPPRVSSRTFGYIGQFAFWWVVSWLRKRHLGLNKYTLIRRLAQGRQIQAEGIDMFRPETVAIEGYRYRGTRIPTPWSPAETPGTPAPAA